MEYSIRKPGKVDLDHSSAWQIAGYSNRSVAGIVDQWIVYSTSCSKSHVNDHILYNMSRDKPVESVYLDHYIRRDPDFRKII